MVSAIRSKSGLAFVAFEVKDRSKDQCSRPYQSLPLRFKRCDIATPTEGVEATRDLLGEIDVNEVSV